MSLTQLFGTISLITASIAMMIVAVRIPSISILKLHLPIINLVVLQRILCLSTKKSSLISQIQITSILLKNQSAKTREKYSLTMVQ